VFSARASSAWAWFGFPTPREPNLQAGRSDQAFFSENAGERQAHGNGIVSAGERKWSLLQD